MADPDYRVEIIVDADGNPDMTVAIVGDIVVDLTGATPGEVLTVQPDGSVAADPAGGGAVDSVNGATGVVVLTAGDVGAAPSALAINTYTDSVTLGLVDVDALVMVNKATAATVTLPTNATATIPIGSVIPIRAMGAGAVSVAAEGGATVASPGSLLTLDGQNAGASATKISTNGWWLEGRLV